MCRSVLALGAFAVAIAIVTRLETHTVQLQALCPFASTKCGPFITHIAKHCTAWCGSSSISSCTSSDRGCGSDVVDGSGSGSDGRRISLPILGLCHFHPWNTDPFLGRMRQLEASFVVAKGGRDY